MTTKLFSELNLSPEVLKAIAQLGFEKASPIQAEAIPVLMTGRDIVGQSETGSGKTAAFAVPAVEKTDPKLRTVQVLILCPTRELAVQVSEEVHKLAAFKKGIHVLPIYGGQSYERQFWGLKQGAQIVIGTPGRVMDHMRRGTLRLDTVKMAVLDEADVMLNMGFREDIETILKSMPKERQTVFFSATMPKPIRDLIERFSREPLTVKIEQKGMTVATVEQVYYEVDRRFKVELLTRLIDIHDYKLGIVFCNTKRMVDDLVDHLNAQGYSADRLHGELTQAMRDRVMNKFRNSALEFLVATDVAARGIDVDNVQVVINYDLPYDPEDYVHRIGRTGRAGRSGVAVSFVAGRELFQINQIERFTKTRIHRGKIPSLDEVEQARATVFLDSIRSTLTKGEFQKQDHLIGVLLEEGFTSTDIASALIHQLQLATGPAPSENRPPPMEDRGRPSRQHEPRDFRGSDRSDRRERDFTIDRPPRGADGPQRGRGERPDFRSRDEARATNKPWGKPASTSASPAASKPAARPIAATETKVKPSPVGAAPKAADRKSAEVSKKPAREPQANKTLPGQTRLYMNIGSEMGVAPRDIAGAIMGETGLPPDAVGTIDIRERHLFANVSSEHANSIIAKLNRSSIREHRLKVKIA